MNGLAKHPHILHEAIIRISKGKHSANAQGIAGLWDHVKDKLGYKSPSKQEKSIPVEDDPVPVYRQPGPSESKRLLSMKYGSQDIAVEQIIKDFK